MRTLRSIVVATFMLMPAEAVASACLDARAQVAGASKGGASRYRAAITRQRVQVVKTERMMVSHRCHRSNSRECSILRNARSKMLANLTRLKRKASGAGVARLKARARRICRAEARRKREAERTRTTSRERASARARKLAEARERVERARLSLRGQPEGIVEPLHDVQDARQRRVRATIEYGTPREAVRGNGSFLRIAPREFQGGTYRTMCVRTCDGFAFPVSLSTSSSGFARDAAACTSMCPGHDMRLFATKDRKGGVKRARDVETGQYYGRMSYAYRYRRRFDQACRCDFRRAVDAMKNVPKVRRPIAPLEGAAGRKPEVFAKVATPTWRPVEKVAEPQVAADDRVEKQAAVQRTDTGVRIIGQSYFPN